MQPKVNENLPNKVTTIAEMMSYEHKTPLVKIRNLEVIFGYGAARLKAVNKMNLNIFKGEVLGLVGESGSGKSTTGNAIAGIVSHQQGSITVNGLVVPRNRKAIKGQIKKQMVEDIQMIFQDPAESLNPHKNVIKVVSEGLLNVDVYKLFAKTYDHATNNELLKLCHAKPVDLVFPSTATINLWITNGNFIQIKTKLYLEPLKALDKITAPWATQALKYLKTRLTEREQYFANKQGKKKLIEKMVIDVLKSVGLSEQVLNRYPLEFSGGQQQRIGISRAIILNPKLLIADEPISALDVSIQAQVVNILNTLKKSLGLTILFIAHDLRMVEYISDRIAVMYKGTLVEVGAVNEIITNPVHPYTKMLFDAVPSIDATRTSLIGYMYSPNMHNYTTDNQPTWVQISGKNHFVYSTLSEANEWVKGNWNTAPLKTKVPLKQNVHIAKNVAPDKSK